MSIESNKCNIDFVELIMVIIFTVIACTVRKSVLNNNECRNIILMNQRYSRLLPLKLLRRVFPEVAGRC